MKKMEENIKSIWDNMNSDKIETTYLTEKELDEITELKTVEDAKNYIDGMSESKKRIVMKQFFKEMAVRQWQTIAAERY